MDWYQQYELCCRISLFQPGEVTIESYDTHYTDYYEGPSSTYKPGFVFDQQTNEIKELGDDSVPGENSIHVKDITREIYQLHQRNTKGEHDLLNDKVFQALSKYFETRFGENFKNHNKSLERIYLLLVVPNEWGLRDDWNNTLVPLFKHAGVAFPQNASEKIAYITQVDAQIINYQLSKYYNEKTPLPFDKEGSCSVVNLLLDHQSIKVSSTNFKLEEDRDLKLLDQELYSAKIESVGISEGLTSLDLAGLEDALSQFLFKDMFELESLINEVYVPDGKEPYSTVAQVILDEVLISLRDALRQGYNFNSKIDIRYDQELLKKHMSKPQSAYMCTEAFFDAVIEKLYELISIKSAADFIVSQGPNPVSIINGCYEIDHHWLQTSLTVVLAYLLKKEILTRDTASQWLLITEGFQDASVRTGSFEKMSRKATAYNMKLPPIVIAEHTALNDIGRPFHYPTTHVVESEIAPSTIVHIDISRDSVHVQCEAVDTKGFVQQQFSIDIDEKLTFDASATNETKELESLFVADVQKIVNAVNRHIESKSISLESIGYVVSVEEKVMQRYHIGTRDSLLKILKENKIVDFESNPRKMIVVDQGDKTFWDLLQQTPINPPSYYMHAHVLDYGVCVKLNQVVDTTVSNGGQPQSSIVLVQETYLSLKDAYEQVSDKFWEHVNRLDEEEKSVFISKDNGYTSEYSEKFAAFLRDQLFTGDGAYETKQSFEIPDSLRMSVSIEQLMDIAIMPVVQEMVSGLSYYLVDKEELGHYDLAGLFITGDLLQTKTHSGTYYSNTIVSEVEKGLTLKLAAEKKLPAAIYMAFETSATQRALQQKAFGYDVFLKGELRVVSSTTYFIGEDLTDDSYDIDLDVVGSTSYGKSNAIVFRGDPFPKRHFEILSDYRAGVTEKYEEFLIAVHKLNEPSTVQDIENASSYLNVLQKDHIHTSVIRVDSKKSLSVKSLPHTSSIKLTIGNTYVEENGDHTHYLLNFTFGERQTLKYI